MDETGVMEPAGVTVRPLRGLVRPCAAMMGIAVVVNLPPVFLTTLAADLGGPAGLTKEQLGRINAVMFVGVVGAMLLTGPLADRLGAKVFTLIGNLSVAAGLALFAWSPDYGTALLACAVMGFGSGMLDAILSPIVSALYPTRRTLALNLLHAFYCVGAVGTILFSSRALEWGWSWRQIALGSAAWPVVVGLGFVPMRMPRLVSAGNDRTPLRTLLGRGHLWLILAAMFLAGGTELGMNAWLPTYAEKGLGFSKPAAGTAFLAFAVAMAAARLGIGLGPRLRPIPLMLASCAGAVVLFLIGAMAPGAWVPLTACCLTGLMAASLWPSTLAVAADRYPHGGASLFAATAAAGNFGGIFMPWVIGLVADRSSLAVGVGLGAVCPAVMMGVLLGLRGKKLQGTVGKYDQPTDPVANKDWEALQ